MFDLPVSVCVETGSVRVIDAKGRAFAHCGEVRNVNGRVLPQEDWIEGESRAQNAQRICDAINNKE
jgi:hypothetical protein